MDAKVLIVVLILSRLCTMHNRCVIGPKGSLGQCSAKHSVHSPLPFDGPSLSTSAGRVLHWMQIDTSTSSSVGSTSSRLTSLLSVEVMWLGGLFDGVSEDRGPALGDRSSVVA